MRTSPDRSLLRSTGQASSQARLVPQFRADVSARHAFAFPSLRTGQRLQRTYVASAKLPGGMLVEVIERPSCPNQTCFLIARGGEFVVADRILAPPNILLPLARHHGLLREVALPDALGEYGSPESLARAVGTFLNSRYPLSEDLQALLGTYPLHTWVYDSLQLSPIMILVAPLNISRPLIESLSQVCMRALRVGTGTINQITRARSELGGTLMLSGSWSRSNTLELLAQSARAGVVALGPGGATSLYGPTILATPRLPDDSNLLSNAIVINLPLVNGASGDRDAREAAFTARGLRNQLLQFRFDFIQNPELSTSEVTQGRLAVAGGLLRALTAPLAADRAFCEQTIRIGRACARPAPERYPRPHRAVISALFFYVHEYIGSVIVQNDRLFSKTGTTHRVHAAEWRDYPGLRVITDLAKGALRGWGKDEALTPSEVGRILTDLGLEGFGPKSASYVLELTDATVRTIHELARFCGLLKVDPYPDASLELDLCPDCRELGFVSSAGIRYFEEHVSPRIRAAERLKLREARRRWAKYKRQPGWLLGKSRAHIAPNQRKALRTGQGGQVLERRRQLVQPHD